MTNNLKIRKARTYSNESYQLSVIGHRLKRGFTLIEILLVIASMAVLFSLSVPLYQSVQVRNDLFVAVDIFTGSVSRAQALSSYMHGDSGWGVRIETTSNKIQNITLFKGSTFPGDSDENNEVFSVSPSIQIDTEDPDFVFNKFTGELSVASATVTFTAPQIGTIQKVVTINRKGKISVTE